MKVKKTDQEQYIENNIFNIKYLIRDVLTYKQLLELKYFLNETIEEQEMTIYKKLKL